jgi:hypothetical protein
MPDPIVSVPDSGQVASLSAMPNAGGVANPVTTTTAPNDVEQRIAAVSQKYEKDINALKSSLQRQQAQRERELQAQIRQAQDNAQAEIRRARLSTLDEPQRKQAEAEMAVTEVQTLRQQNEQLQQEVQTRDIMQGWTDWFIQQGVPASKLDRSDPNALLSSGWEAQAEILSGLRQEVEQLKNPTKPQQPPTTQSKPNNMPQAPDVLTQTSQVPYVNRWADLEKKYGDRETVYRKVEQGLLPPSALPSEE